MSNRKETYGFEGQFSGGDKYPEDLTIVGIDCPVEDFPELADDRIHDELDPNDIQSVRDHGVRIPIEIRRLRGDNRNFVSYGRHRVRWAREANKDLKGNMRIKVPCLIAEAGSDPLTASVIENGKKKLLTPLQCARLAQRMRARRHTEQEIASAFGVTVQAVAGWTKLLEAGIEALDAVETGEVTTEAAKAVAAVPPPKRAEAIAAAKGKKGAAAVEAVKRVAEGKAPAEEAEGRRALSKTKLRALRDAFEPNEGEERNGTEDTDLAWRLVRVILGEGSPALLKSWPEVASCIRKAGVK